MAADGLHPPRWTTAAVAAVALLALLLRLVKLGAYGLWTDETFTLHVALRDLPGVLLSRDQTPPLFALVLHVWAGVFGSSDVALRMPSVLVGTAMVPVVHRVAARFLRPSGALVAAGLMATSVYYIVVSQEARAFALLGLTTTASFLALLRLQERWSAGRAASYAVISALMLYSHLYGAFFLLAQNAYVLWDRSPAPWWSRRWLALQALVGTLFAPWLPALLESVQRVGNGFWITPPSLGDVFWVRYVLTGTHVLSWALPLAAAWALWHDGRRLVERGPDRRRLLWAWLVVPIAVPVAVSLAYPMFIPRYVLPAAVPAMLLAVRGLELVPARAWRLAATVVIVVAAAAGPLAFFATGEPQDSRQDWPTTIATIEGQAVPGAVVVFNKGYCDSTSDRDVACSYERYATRDLPLIPFFFEDRGVSEPVNATTVRKLDPLVAGAPQVWVVFSYPSDTGGHIDARLQALGYRETGEWHVKKIDFWRYDRDAAIQPHAAA